MAECRENKHTGGGDNEVCEKSNCNPRSAALEEAVPCSFHGSYFTVHTDGFCRIPYQYEYHGKIPFVRNSPFLHILERKMVCA